MTNPPERQRRLARDAEGRIGEVMPSGVPAHLANPKVPPRIRLRPPGGGVEWWVKAEEVEYLEPEQ